MPLYLIDAGGHLLHKQALLLSLPNQAGEEGEAIVVGPRGARRGLRGNVRRGRGGPGKHRRDDADDDDDDTLSAMMRSMWRVHSQCKVFSLLPHDADSAFLGQDG